MGRMSYTEYNKYNSVISGKNGNSVCEKHTDDLTPTIHMETNSAKDVLNVSVWK
jgi:hypothetical protein